jgi:hypothetical protein
MFLFGRNVIFDDRPESYTHDDEQLRYYTQLVLVEEGNRGAVYAVLLQATLSWQRDGWSPREYLIAMANRAS